MEEEGAVKHHFERRLPYSKVCLHWPSDVGEWMASNGRGLCMLGKKN